MPETRGCPRLSSRELPGVMASAAPLLTATEALRRPDLPPAHAARSDQGALGVRQPSTVALAGASSRCPGGAAPSVSTNRADRRLVTESPRAVSKQHNPSPRTRPPQAFSRINPIDPPQYLILVVPHLHTIAGKPQCLRYTTRIPIVKGLTTSNSQRVPTHLPTKYRIPEHL